MELNARIFKARKDAGLTQEELADAVGKTRGAVAQWESGEVRPRHTTLLAIAKATAKPFKWLESGIGDDSIGLKVIGEVAAGLWKEESLEFVPFGVPVAPHPDYPANAQRLYKVSGNSVNRVVADGEFIHCVNVLEAGLIPGNGDLVVVIREQHGRYEYTAKRLLFIDGNSILRPESYDDRWQEDIEISGDGDTTIRISDIIIAKWSPLRFNR
jgi:transcriptional regulator with XRE-family HTH domain